MAWLKTDLAGDPRDAVFRRWLPAAGVQDPGVFASTAQLFASWQAFAGADAGAPGWLAARLRAEGVQPHRTRTAKGFRFSLAGVDEIKKKSPRRRSRGRRPITPATPARSWPRSKKL